jgi:DNA polymerase/3'-5' exonuclease PolX
VTSTKRDLPLAVGQETAAALVALLTASCERIEVVGSVRRGESIVHDVELLLEPKTRTEVVDLFGTTESVSLFEEKYADAARRGAITPIMGGARLKRFLFRGVSCELFICIPPSQWGLAQVVRTGPASFNYRLVTPQRLGGWLPDRLHVQNLCIQGPLGAVIATATEADVFAVLGREFIDPEARQ